MRRAVTKNFLLSGDYCAKHSTYRKFITHFYQGAWLFWPHAGYGLKYLITNTGK